MPCLFVNPVVFGLSKNFHDLISHLFVDRDFCMSFTSWIAIVDTLVYYSRLSAFREFIMAMQLLARFAASLQKFLRLEFFSVLLNYRLDTDKDSRSSVCS